MLRAFDPADKGVELVEFHEHEDGEPCNLGTVEEERALYLRDPKAYRAGVWAWFHFPKERCSLGWHAIKSTCGCHLCTNHDENRQDRRNDRHSARVQMNQMRKLVASGAELE